MSTRLESLLPAGIPDGWVLEVLNNLTVQGTSISYGVVQPGPEDTNGVLFIRGGDIKGGKINDNLRTIRKEVSDSYKRTLVKGGEIVISLVGYPGECAIIPSSLSGANIARQVGLVRLKKEYNAVYLQQYLSSEIGKSQLLENTVGSAQQVINLESLRKVKIVLPPLAEQQKIAEILSTLDEKMTVMDEQLAQTQELKKGLMQRLLIKGIGHTNFKDSPLGGIPESWENATFNDLVKFSGGAQPPRSTFVFEPQEGYIRLVQTRDYRTDKYKTYIPAALARKKCTEQDIMIGRYGPPIFQILRGIKGAYNVALVKAIPNESKILREYLFYYISQYEVWAFVENLSQRGGGQTGVDLDELKKYPFPLPPFTEQKQIVELLTTVDDKLQVLTDKKAQYQDLKRGLMQQLLTGQRRVRVGAAMAV